jgi:GntR family transcriptional regulator, histidine utilization repressor
VSLKSPSGSGATAHYLRVKRSVVDRIAKGSLKPGARVPSENELVREFGLSRMTVNRALRELAADGVLQRIAGVGTFVAEQRVPTHPLHHNLSRQVYLDGRHGGPQ